jgi:hypothetical protein
MGYWLSNSITRYQTIKLYDLIDNYSRETCDRLKRQKAIKIIDL